MAGQKFQLTPFHGNVPGLTQYLQQQFDRLWEMQQGGDPVVMLPVVNVEPDKLLDGMLIYADGTNWDPGNGEGFYGYWAGAWHPLHT